MLINHLLPRDVLNAVTAERITGLAAVPPLWACSSVCERNREARNQSTRSEVRTVHGLLATALAVLRDGVAGSAASWSRFARTCTR